VFDKVKYFLKCNLFSLRIWNFTSFLESDPQQENLPRTKIFGANLSVFFWRVQVKITEFLTLKNI